jgi:hypothetical protein
MLARARHVRGGHPDYYYVALFCLTLNRNSNERSNPLLWTTEHPDVAQRRCYKRHYDEVQASGYMTTFELDTWDPHFNLLPRFRFIGGFTVFETGVDVLGVEWDGVNSLAHIQLCPVTSIFIKHNLELSYIYTLMSMH